MTLQPPIPVLRMFDAALAKRFYLDWLGFKLDWEHHLEADAPGYIQLSRGAVLLHVSEHYGDCSPGAKLLIHTDDVESLHRELSEKQPKYAALHRAGTVERRSHGDYGSVWKPFVF